MDGCATLSGRGILHDGSPGWLIHLLTGYDTDKPRQDFKAPPNVTDTEEMSPLKLVPARRRAQDARGNEAERSRAGRPQNRKNGPQAQAQPRLQPREKVQEKAQRRAPAAASGEIPPEGERLNKHLARTGVCSRREEIGRAHV